MSIPLASVGDLRELVGGTPTLRTDSDCFLKLELMNPGRSLADRLATRLINVLAAASQSVRIAVLDELSVSMLLLSRASDIDSCVAGSPTASRSMRAAADELVHLFGCQNFAETLSGTASRGFGAFVAQHWEPVLHSTWLEIRAEMGEDLGTSQEYPTIYVPYLPWYGLGPPDVQAAVVVRSFGANAVLVVAEDEVANLSGGSLAVDVVAVNRRDAEVAASELSTRWGVTASVLGGRVWAAMRTKGRGQEFGVIADSSEWHQFVFAE